MTPSYKIIETPPYDKDTPNTFWIRKESKVWFELKTKIEVLGNYKIDGTYGELGWMPFFNKKSAKKRIKILKKL